jgi:hypothetical protein
VRSVCLVGDEFLLTASFFSHFAQGWIAALHEEKVPLDGQAVPIGKQRRFGGSESISRIQVPYGGDSALGDFNDIAAHAAGMDSSRRRSGDVSQWCAFGAGMIAAMAAMYLAVARPIADELERLQGRVVELDRSVRTVAGQKDSVRHANDVLALLAEQGKRSTAAGEALENIRSLHERLAGETSQVERALVALENLSTLKTSLLEHAPQVKDAAVALSGMQDIDRRMLEGRQNTAGAWQALATLEEVRDKAIALEQQSAAALASLNRVDSLQQRIAAEDESTRSALVTLDSLVGLKERVSDQADDLPAAHAALVALVDLKDRAAVESAGLSLATNVIKQWSQIQSHLIAAQRQTADAQQVSNDLIVLSHDLVSRGSDRPAARAALEGLIGMRERLDIQATGLEVAQERAEILIALKNRLVAQTSNLAEAIETLELTTDLHDQLEKAVRSFDRMRHAVIEIMAFEPTVERALSALEPLTALGNLRHLNGGELREVARSVRDQRNTEYSRVPVTPASTGVHAGPSASLPPSAAGIEANSSR